MDDLPQPDTTDECLADIYRKIKRAEDTTRERLARHEDDPDYCDAIWRDFVAEIEGIRVVVSAIVRAKAQAVACSAPGAIRVWSGDATYLSALRVRRIEEATNV
jgi:hypothetical protein